MRKTLNLMTHDCRPITGQAETGETLELIGQVRHLVSQFTERAFFKTNKQTQHKKHNVNSAK